ncbi:MAG: PQQ-binding-like beta-propeller repeat protein [Polyangiaceae bacterium]|nr:PQQ-binding-like beta-propeller repeat protein [Polyangiaceae bacterium]
MIRRLAALLPLVSLAACSAGQTRLGRAFTTDWEDDGGRSISALEARLRDRQPAPPVDVAVGVGDDAIVGIPLSGGSTWTFSHKLSSRPDVAGGVVVGAGDGELFCLQSSTGNLLWRRAIGGGELIGAGDDGELTVVAIEQPGGTGSTALAIARDGTVLRQVETDKKIGRPAVLAGIAFFPWQGQYVTAYDIGAGDEIARVTLRVGASHALRVGGALYFGEISLVRFDEGIGGASRGLASTLTLPERELVGTARWLQPAGERKEVTAGATDKVRVYARPTPAPAPLAVEGGAYYSTYYRLAFGLSATDPGLRWVRPLAADALGGAAYRGGLALCDAEGKVTFYDAASGMPNGALSLGRALRSCVVLADGLERAASGAAPPSLAAQMGDALRVGAHDLVTAQRYILRELAQQQDGEATRVLVELARDPRTSPALAADVRAMLAARRTGAEHLLAALGQSYDYLRDVSRPPPVGPIADALAAMGERRAAPLLVKALLDPQTSPDDVKHAAAAMIALGGEAEVRDLEAFLALNRATAENDDMVEAVGRVAEALVKIAGLRGKIIVARAARDTFTLPSVKARLEPLAEGVVIPADEDVDVKPTKKKGKA